MARTSFIYDITEYLCDQIVKSGGPSGPTGRAASAAGARASSTFEGSAAADTKFGAAPSAAQTFRRSFQRVDEPEIRAITLDLGARASHNDQYATSTHPLEALQGGALSDERLGEVVVLEHVVAERGDADVGVVVGEAHHEPMHGCTL